MLKVYAMYDSKVQSFGPLLCFRQTGEAIRWVIDMAKEPQSSIGRHPEDYTLMELGSYDDVKGVVESLSSPHNCGLASEFVNKESR